MDAEKDEDQLVVLRVIAGRARSAAPADLERECPELSAAAFQRFVKAANETDLTVRALRRARITRRLLALVLVGLVRLIVFSAGGRKEEGTTQGAELTRLQHEVCRGRCPSCTARLTPLRISVSHVPDVRMA